MSDEPKTPTDLLLPLTDPNEAGEQIALRKDASGVHLGTIGPVLDGQPIPPDAEVIGLQHLDGPVYEVTESTHKGPAKVNSKAYRNNWDGIFGAKKPTSDLVN